MQFANPYQSMTSKMQSLEIWIIVQSILYYEYDSTLVTDRVYDITCKQFVSMIEEDRHSFEQTRFYYAFYDFDGTTGFDIPSRLSEEDNNYLQRYLGPAIRLTGNGGTNARQANYAAKARNLGGNGKGAGKSPRKRK